MNKMVELVPAPFHLPPISKQFKFCQFYIHNILATCHLFLTPSASFSGGAKQQVLIFTVFFYVVSQKKTDLQPPQDSG